MLFALPYFSPQFNHQNDTGTWYRLWNSSPCNFFQPPVTYSVSALNILLTAFQISLFFYSLYVVNISQCYWNFFSFNSSIVFISERQVFYCNWAEQCPYAVADPPVLCHDLGRSNVLYHWFGVLFHTGNACCVITAVSVKWCWTEVQNVQIWLSLSILLLVHGPG